MKAIELRSTASRLSSVAILCVIAILSFASLTTAQSTSINYPTPLYNNEISGTIRARDIGDSRLTSYFYTFDGAQGDVFMNVVTKNFTGDIDIFLAEGLKPLTKVPIYADNGETETGRVIYLRKPEKLILRIEGRTPNDDPATFQIKFAGSFQASAESAPIGPDEPKVEAVAESNIRVNSVGTIIEVIPKAKPSPKPPETAERVTENKAEAETRAADENKADVEKEEAKPAVVVTENIPAAKNPPAARTRTRRGAQPSRPAPKRTEEAATKKAQPPDETTAPPSPSRTASGRKQPASVPEPDPLANIHLVIEFKDGSRVERPMSEVRRFSVDRGILTVVGKDGSIGRYPILDVARTTIQ